MIFTFETPAIIVDFDNLKELDKWFTTHFPDGSVSATIDKGKKFVSSFKVCKEIDNALFYSEPVYNSDVIVKVGNFVEVFSGDTHKKAVFPVFADMW